MSVYKELQKLTKNGRIIRINLFQEIKEKRGSNYGVIAIIYLNVDFIGISEYLKKNYIRKYL